MLSELKSLILCQLERAKPLIQCQFGDSQWVSNEKRPSRYRPITDQMPIFRPSGLSGGLDEYLAITHQLRAVFRSTSRLQTSDLGLNSENASNRSNRADIHHRRSVVTVGKATRG
jgi:hypothetical protein